MSAESDLEKIATPPPGADHDARLAAAKQTLESEVERGRDAREEERFIWAVIVTILFDVIVFDRFETWTAPVIIGALEMVVLLVLARRWGIQEVDTLVARVLHSLGRK